MLYKEVVSTATSPQNFDYAMSILDTFDRAVNLIPDIDQDTEDLKDILRSIDIDVGSVKTYRECSRNTCV